MSEPIVRDQLYEQATGKIKFDKAGANQAPLNQE
jgi:hypothetical protein